MCLKGPCKRMQHCWPTTLNMLRPFAYRVARCWEFLEDNRKKLVTFSTKIKQNYTATSIKKTRTLLCPFCALSIESDESSTCKQEKEF